jgi:very-short-patch-repair endonuclease
MKLSGPWVTIKRARKLRVSMSKPELMLWHALRRQQTGYRFRRQHPAGPYVLDFYCDAAKLCIEVDGEQHGFTTGHDAARDAWLRRQGVRTLRIRARDVLTDLDAMIRWITAEATSPSASLRSAPPPMGEE